MKLCECGENLQDNANFCPNCGKKLAKSTSTCRAITFEEFRKAKGASRVSTLPSSKGKKPKPLGKVTIQIGIKQYKQDVSLKALKGRTLPLTVDANINANDLLKEAVTKHSKHFRTFTPETEYKLLYPDNTVVRHLRSSQDRFTLQKYKEELGKPFSKIYLYLCADNCLHKAEMHDLGLSEDEIEDVPYSTLPSVDSTVSPLHTQNLSSSLCTIPASNPKPCGSISFTPSPPITTVLNQVIPKPDAQPHCQVILVEDHDSRTDGHDPPASKRSRSIQSSILPFIDHGENQSSKIACPLCFNNFSSEEIARHADECAQKFDPIGVVPVNGSGSENEDNENPQNDNMDEPEQTFVDPTIQQIKEIVLSKLCPNIHKDHTNKVNIRRMYAFQDYMEIRKKHKPKRPFEENAMLKVTFYGEPAVDDGGPRREFFTESLEQIERRLFLNGVPTCDMKALAQEEYKVAGELMSMSIVQGGPAPCFLRRHVYLYIAKGVDSLCADVADDVVEDLYLKDVIKKVPKKFVIFSNAGFMCTIEFLI